MGPPELAEHPDIELSVPKGTTLTKNGFDLADVKLVDLPGEVERIGPVGGGVQPILVMGPAQELFMPSRLDHTFAGCCDIYHSTDGGQHWGTLCEIPYEYLHPDFIANVVGYKGPPNEKLKLGSMCVAGVLRDGTLLVGINHWGEGTHGGVHEDPSYYMRTFIIRSTDRGSSWTEPVEIDPYPFDVVGGNPTRFYQMPDGRVLVPLMTYPGPEFVKGEPFRQFAVSYLYSSEDGGCTWKRYSTLGRYTCESDLLLLPCGRMLAATRYQRSRMSWDARKLAEKYPRGSIYKQTYLLHSHDEGRTWGTPKMLTGASQQTGCIVRLSDGTLVVPFGSKPHQDQRAIFSYDDGVTWSRNIYQIAQEGMYASSVVLPDDTIVTVYANAETAESKKTMDLQRGRKTCGKFGLEINGTRWKAPTKDEVSAGGFFTPQPFGVEP